MNLYICKAPIRFPASEYGGLVVVIAKNKKNCGKIITKAYKEFSRSDFDLSISVNSCKELSLNPENNYSEGIVSEFIT